MAVGEICKYPFHRFLEAVWSNVLLHSLLKMSRAWQIILLNYYLFLYKPVFEYIPDSKSSLYGFLIVRPDRFSEEWPCHPGHVAVKHHLYCLDIELLVCHDIYVTVTQESSVRGLFILVVRLTATGDRSCPQHHLPYDFLKILEWWELGVYNILFIF